MVLATVTTLCRPAFSRSLCMWKKVAATPPTHCRLVRQSLQKEQLIGPTWVWALPLVHLTKFRKMMSQGNIVMGACHREWEAILRVEGHGFNGDQSVLWCGLCGTPLTSPQNWMTHFLGLCGCCLQIALSWHPSLGIALEEREPRYFAQGDLPSQRQHTSCLMELQRPGHLSQCGIPLKGYPSS